MRFLLLFLSPLLLLATSDFITPLEYATQLYKNPRGIGCDRCHGKKGEGKLIAKYKHKGVKKSFSGPRIDEMPYKDFFKALNDRKRGMPRYYLTQKEIKALYLYIHQDDKKKSKK